MHINRRKFVQGAAIFGAGGLSGCLINQQSSGAENVAPEHSYKLVVQESSAEIVPGTQTDVATYNGGIPAPIIRATQGKPVRIEVLNNLKEETTVHWHGLRIPVHMDGVPITGQAPVQPGETFVYEFTPPDAGTMWYHSHANSVTQLGRGLVGAMIVEEPEPLPFDQDITLLFKNWHLEQDGQYYPLTQRRYAARQGTPGLVYTTNGKTAPTYEIEENAVVRLRAINADNTLQYPLQFAMPGAEIMAIDANPIAKRLPVDGFLLGTGMRADIGFVVPNKVGEQYELRDEREVLAVFKIVEGGLEEGQRSEPGQLPTLPTNPVPEPDLSNAENIDMIVEWGVGTDYKGDPLFWNLKTAPGQEPKGCTYPNQIAALKLGNSYIFTIRNNTQYPHPIHFHGHTFRVLNSNKKEFDTYLADTVVLEENEQVQVAFVADNPGHWMFHCHVIEHMVVGLVGLVEVA